MVLESTRRNEKPQNVKYMGKLKRVHNYKYFSVHLLISYKIGLHNKSHQIVNFEHENFMGHKLYLNKTVQEI